MSLWADHNPGTGVFDSETLVPSLETSAVTPASQSSMSSPSIPTMRRELACLSEASFMKETSTSSHILANNADGINELSSGSTGSSFSSNVQDDWVDVSRSTKGSQTNGTDKDLPDTAPSSPQLSAEQNLFFDLGFETLDDVLGVEDASQYVDSPFLRPQSSLSLKVEPSSSFELEAGNDELVQDHESSTAHLFDFPAPKVLQTGFDVSKSVRGGLYDYTKPRPHRSSPSKSTSSFNRSGIPTGPRFNHMSPTRTGGQRSWCPQTDDGILELTYKPSEFESNYYRTVSLSALATSIHLRDVLARIRGGTIKSAIMTDTTAITGSKTAIVQFVLEDAAFCYVLYTGRYPIVFRDEETRAVISRPSICRVNTPTFPPSRYKLNGLEGCNQTRCVSIQEFPEDLNIDRVAEDINFRFQFRLDTLLECYFGEDDLLHLEFSSIEAASFAYIAISNWSREVRVRFETDPCSRPLKDLRKPAEVLPSIPIADSQWLGKSTDEQAKLAEENSSRFKNLLSWITSHGARPTPQLAEKAPPSRFIPHHAQPIPPMNGSGLKGFSWADEVMDEMDVEDSVTQAIPLIPIEAGRPPSSTLSTGNSAVGDIIDMMDASAHKSGMEYHNISTAGEPDFGEAASEHASETPGFSNLDSALRTILGPTPRETAPGVGQAADLMRLNAESCEYRAAPEERSTQIQTPASYIDELNHGEIMQSIERDDDGDDRDMNYTGRGGGGERDGNAGRRRDRRSSESGNGDDDSHTEDGDDTISENESLMQSPDISIRDLTGDTLVEGSPSFSSSPSSSTPSSTSSPERVTLYTGLFPSPPSSSNNNIDFLTSHEVAFLSDEFWVVGDEDTRVL